MALKLDSTMKLKKYFIFGSVVFLLDRITKLWALKACAAGKIIASSWLSCQVVFNRGISWSLLSADSSVGFALVTVLVMAVIGCIIWYAYQQYKEQQPIWAEVAVIAAACSNVVDRFWYGGVVDFILLEYQGWSWPLFNFADCVIVVGIFCMLFQNFYNESRCLCKE